VAAELVPHRGQEPVGERLRLAAAEARHERESDDRRGDGALDSLLHGPAPFARVFDPRFDVLEPGILSEGAGHQILVPGGPRGNLHKHSQADNVYIVRRGEGTLTISQGGTTQGFKVRGGFLQVVSDVVRIVAEDAQTA